MPRDYKRKTSRQSWSQAAMAAALEAVNAGTPFKTASKIFCVPVMALSKQVARVTSAERGNTTTAVICMSAAGNFVPPMLIFRRERMKKELMDGAPPGAVYACNNSGWMKVEVFAKWFDHFLAHVKPSAEDPALLILDGHLSHTKNLDVILKVRESNVTILCLPPHCTHKLQPLDVGVMYPLSIYHNQALEKWMNNNPGRVVSVFQISKIFAESYLKAAVPLNAINGFKKCGIVSFDPDVFSDIDFVAAETTEQPLEPDNNDLTAPINIAPIATTEPRSISSVCLPFTPSPPRSETLTQPPSQTLSSPPHPIHPQSASSSASIITSAITTPRMPSVDTIIPIPSTSFSNATPSSIKPLPKISGKRSQNRRRTGGTSILTGTPYKNKLEDDRKRKTEQELKRASRAEKKAKKSVVSQKGKGKSSQRNKENKNKNRVSSESSSEEDDTECMFCNKKYSRDKGGEGWIRCCVCLRWGHDECAGIDSNDADEFTCDFCLSDRFRGVRKNLSL